MIVGTLTVSLEIPGSDSLKDKRQVVKSLLASVRNKFNAAAAEIDHLDSHRRALLGFAVVSNSQSVANGMLDKIMDLIESNPLCDVTDSTLDFL